LPSHALVVWFAFEQLDPHTVVAPGYVHTEPLVPSHVPAHVPFPSHALRVPCGAPLTGMQCPAWPIASHASHCALQSDSQQTPSTQ
jgi:hypothetical protein